MKKKELKKKKILVPLKNGNWIAPLKSTPAKARVKRGGSVHLKYNIRIPPGCL